MRFLSFLFVVFLFIPASWAGEFGANRQRPWMDHPARVDINASTAIDEEAMGGAEEIRYNVLPEGPLFNYRLLERNVPIFNGGLGDGMVVAGTPDSYHSYQCSGQNEVDGLRALNGLERRFSPNTGAGDEGHYDIVRVENRCRLEGRCGSIVPDGRSFVIGFPIYKTNCRLYKKGYYDHEVLTTANPADSSSTSSPYNPMYPAWLNRSRGSDVLFSRYLVNQLQENLEGEALREEAIDALRLSVDGFTANPDATDPNYIDLAHDPEHLEWGFTCGEICKTGGYRRNPEINCQSELAPRVSVDPRSPSSGFTVISDVPPPVLVTDQEFLDHHRLSLEIAVNRLGNDIIAGAFGNLDAPRETLTAQQKGMRETVVTIWHILKDRLDNGVHWEPCTNATCRLLRRVDRVVFGRDPLEVRRCEGLPGDIKVQLRRKEGALCLSPQIVDDCHAKRFMGSVSAYHISGGCEPSYGEMGVDGIWEQNWEIRRGYVLTPVSVGSGDNRVDFIISTPTHERPSDGWSPFATAMIAHQLVHDYYQKKLGKNRIKGWPHSHDALWEEETAAIAQALVFFALQEEGYAPVNFSMQKDLIVPTVETRNLTVPDGRTLQQVVGGTDGVRYSYHHEPRGRNGVYLGPQFASLRNIARVLYGEENNPELARMMALLYSMAPILDPPAGTVRDGQVVEGTP